MSAWGGVKDDQNTNVYSKIDFQPKFGLLG
jgi:hypothetical protein